MFDFVSAGFCRGNSVGTEQQRRAAMTCEGCSVKFSVFKRRRQCSICQQNYCSHCLSLGHNGSSHSSTSVLARFTDKKLKCSKCEVLTARPLCRSQLRQLRVKDLQLYLSSQQVSTRGCVEKDDLVNLLIRHAGNSTNNAQRSDVLSSHSSQTGLQGGDQSSVTRDQPGQYFQQQSASTAPHISAQCFPSTSETSHSSDQSDSSATCESNTIADYGGGENASFTSSSSGPQAPTVTTASISHENSCHVLTSSSSSSSQSTTGWNGESSPMNVDIVELTDWVGDVNNSDFEPEPMITVDEDESPERTFNMTSHVSVLELSEDTVTTGDTAVPASNSSSAEADVAASVEEVEVMEVEEVTNGATNVIDDIITVDVPTEEVDVVTRDPVITTQACTGITLASITNLEDLEKLTVKQLKELLSLNRVDYRGCCEKPELVERVTRLWQEDSQTRKGLDNMSMDELCKICMDAPVECVMLECGHMATCTACGKQLSECPICRQFVVRVVRTFRA